MAGHHRLSPLPAVYLRNVGRLLKEIADVYENAADSLKGEHKSLPVEKFLQLTGGIGRLLSHTAQIATPLKRAEIERLYQAIEKEPLPAESYDRTKGGRPPLPDGKVKKITAAGTAAGADLADGKPRKKKPPGK